MGVLDAFSEMAREVHVVTHFVNSVGGEIVYGDLLLVSVILAFSLLLISSKSNRVQECAYIPSFMSN